MIYFKSQMVEGGKEKLPHAYWLAVKHEQHRIKHYSMHEVELKLHITSCFTKHGIIH
jgi:hypothetical protein